MSTEQEFLFRVFQKALRQIAEFEPEAPRDEGADAAAFRTVQDIARDALPPEPTGGVA